MKKGTRKALLALCCAMILVAISVGATLAYLTDSEAVTNTFTVGQVGLKLDEADTDDSTDGKDRDTANVYHLLPGQTYDKDPTVHVDADSEASWLFVKVENGIELIEAPAVYKNAQNVDATGTIAAQMEAFGWTELDGVDNVYYQAHAEKQPTAKDYVVFKAFKISGEATNQPETTYGTDGPYISNSDVYLPNYANAQVKVTAYAIQMAGFEGDAAAAWAAGKFAEI